ADGSLAACSHGRTSARPASKAVLKSSRFRGREEYGSACSWVKTGGALVEHKICALPQNPTFGHGCAKPRRSRHPQITFPEPAPSYTPREHDFLSASHRVSQVHCEHQRRIAQRQDHQGSPRVEIY